jgi:hypothetical protein
MLVMGRSFDSRALPIAGRQVAAGPKPMAGRWRLLDQAPGGGGRFRMELPQGR